MVKIRVKKIVWDDWNIKHIEKHKVNSQEIRQVLKSKTKTLKTYQKRFLVLGQTKKKRLLSIVLASEKKGKYYLVTARNMSKKERRYYHKKKNS